MKENKLSKGNLWAFALGTVGRDMAAAGLFLNYLITYVMLTNNSASKNFLSSVLCLWSHGLSMPFWTHHGEYS